MREGGAGARVASKAGRQEAVRRIIRERAVATQDDLGRLLAQEGYAVTQATLSRDLAQLGAMRVSLPGGGTVYALDASAVPADEAMLRALGQQAISVRDNGTMVVIRTQPGLAPALAAALDRARLQESLGTIAGDDTIFAAPARGTSARQLARRLEALLGLGGTT